MGLIVLIEILLVLKQLGKVIQTTITLDTPRKARWLLVMTGVTVASLRR